MAKLVSVGFDDLIKEFNVIADHSGDIAAKMLYTGSGEMADSIKNSIEGLKTEEQRKHVTSAVTPDEQDALAKGLSIKKFNRDKSRDYIQTSISFKGYTDKKTKAYPTGIPVILLARSIQSGTSFRKPNRYFTNTVNRNKKKVEETMKNVAESELRKLVK